MGSRHEKKRVGDPERGREALGRAGGKERVREVRPRDGEGTTNKDQSL